MRDIELLIPAGGPDVLKTAFDYGADAVYMGGFAFGLRAKAHNFSMHDIEESVSYAHSIGKKVYITANILAHNEDLEDAPDYFRQMQRIRPDALLISDPGLFVLAKKYAPDIPIHISTQANNVNYGTYNFWRELGASRVVAGRELSLAEIAQIRRNIPQDMEIEAFVHGAMCISYSGRCLLSNFLTGRDANRGECTHPCRWRYSIVEETRPGEYMPVYENERGTYIFNSRDLCMIEHIPEMIEAGIDSLKVEGRMKTALYVATVARTYRMAIDDYREDPLKYRDHLELYKTEIGKCTYRPFTTGFFFGKPGSDAQIYDDNTYVKNYIYLGTVDEVEQDGRLHLIQKNKFSVGDEIEIMKKDGANLAATVRSIRDDDGCEMESCPHSKQSIHVATGEGAEPGDILRQAAPSGTRN